MSRNPTNKNLEALNSRQADIFDTDKAAKTSVLIIGAGGIGSNVAHLLSSMGILDITLLDMGVVEPENVFPGYFSLADVNVAKVDSVKYNLMKSHGTTVEGVMANLHDVVPKWGADPDKGWDIVLVCTDDLPTREVCHMHLQRKAVVWIDARMGGTGAHVFSYITNDEDAENRYLRAAFGSDPEPLPCGMKATAPITKGFLTLAIGQIIFDVLHDKKPPEVIRYDLLDRMFVAAG